MKKLLFTIFVCSTLSAGMFDNVINPNGKPGLLTVSLSAAPKPLTNFSNNQSSWNINPGATLPVNNWMTVKYKRYYASGYNTYGVEIHLPLWGNK